MTAIMPGIGFDQVTPVLRMFDIARAEEFYLGFLGFKVDWDHRFDAHAPLYRQISRGTLVLHLSEHHGDGCPGAHVRIQTRNIEAFHREITARQYGFMRPGLDDMPWGTREVGVIDPFGNRLRFWAPRGEEAGQE